MVPSDLSAALGASLPPDLTRVVNAWNHLPDAIRRGILALIEASQM